MAIRLKCRFNESKDCPFGELPNEPQWCVACVRADANKVSLDVYKNQSKMAEASIKWSKLSAILQILALNPNVDVAKDLYKKLQQYAEEW